MKGKRPAIDIVNRSLARRYRAEKRFRFYGISAIIVSLVFLAILFAAIISRGYTAFIRTTVEIEAFFDPALIDSAALSSANYQAVVKKSLRKMFPKVRKRRDRKRLYALVSSGAAFQLRNMVMDDPGLVGKTVKMWVPASGDVDMYIKGQVRENPDGTYGRLDKRQLGWLERLQGEGKIRTEFNRVFFTAGDSRNPELAGILGAVSGSFYMLLVTLLLSFPVGVAAAVSLEEFMPKNIWSDFIEVNINNLAAVPSIVFGLLGLAVCINFFGFQRSTPLVGGIVMALMTLPTIIIASRASIQTVPPSIREAALGIGASRMQMITHHVLPLAMPGIMTGTIIGMARALGETAPLLMIGMVAFIVDIPHGFTDPATALPVQIYLWADSPERGFVEKTSAATMVLLAFLIIMTASAIILRKKFERRW